MKTFFFASYTLLLCAIFSLVSTSSVNAQSELKGSGTLIEEGIKVYDTGNYKQAIKFYAQVPEGDTNYLLAQYEMGLAYNADSQFTLARNLAIKALEHPDAETRLFLLLLGNTYDYLGKQDSAIQCYDQLLARNPNDYQVYYEMGILHLRKERMDSTIYYLEKAIMLNPYHFRSLKVLGSCYGLQGRLTEAWVCIQSSLLIANNYTQAQTPITYLDGIVKQTDEFSEAYQNKKEKHQHPLYDEIDAILHAKLVLGDEYKIKSVLDDEPQAKGLYAILEKLKYDPKDNNFAMQYFVPLLIEIKEKDLVDPYLLHLYSGYEIEKIEKLAAKEKSAITKTKEICNNYLKLITATRTLNYEARKKAPLKFTAINAENLLICSNMKTLEEWAEGPALVYKSGTLSARGQFNKNGKKEGTWTYYYPNGQIKTIENIKDGDLVGEEQKFYKSGILKSKARYNNEHQSEYEISYSRNGESDEEYELLKDKSIRNTTFHPNGKKKFSVILVKDVYQDGNYEGFYEDGTVSRKLSIKDGKLDGEYKDFYEGGKLNGQYIYNKGKLDGEYKSFYKDGKPFIVSHYKEGVLEGLFEKWNEDGLYLSKQTYKNGKLDGKRLYFDEGKEYGYVTYKDGLPVDYEFKDLKGNPVAADKGPLKVLKIYFSNGNLQAEFPLDAGKVSGKAKFYTYGGSLREETEYSDDLKEGSEKTYFKNGKLNYEASNKADERTGYYKGYNMNGRLIAEGWLDNDNKQGIWKYFHVNGMPTSRSFFQNNEISGFSEDYNIKGELTVKDFYTENVNYRTIQYDSNGKEFNRINFEKGNGKYLLKFQGSNNTWFECQQVNGLLEGPYKKYYPDGAIRELGIYKNGQRHGDYSFYNFNGQKTILGTYKEGKTSGKWVYLENNDDTSSIINYDEGMAEGKKYAYENGRLYYESNYRNDLREGPQYIYDNEKKLAIVMNFSEGILMSYSYEGKDGKLLPAIEVKNGSAAVKAFYANGNKSIEFNYLESYYNGVQKFYYSNGILAEERNYSYGDVNGEWKEWHPNGKVRLTCSYKDDELHGAYESFTENGEKILAYNYYFGELHGQCEAFDFKTKTMKKMLFRYGYPVKRL